MDTATITTFGKYLIPAACSNMCVLLFFTAYKKQIHKTDYNTGIIKSMLYSSL